MERVGQWLDACRASCEKNERVPLEAREGKKEGKKKQNGRFVRTLSGEKKNADCQSRSQFDPIQSNRFDSIRFDCFTHSLTRSLAHCVLSFRSPRNTTTTNNDPAACIHAVAVTKQKTKQQDRVYESALWDEKRQSGDRRAILANSDAVGEKSGVFLSQKKHPKFFVETDSRRLGVPRERGRGRDEI